MEAFGQVLHRAFAPREALENCPTGGVRQRPKNDVLLLHGICIRRCLFVVKGSSADAAQCRNRASSPGAATEESFAPPAPSHPGPRRPLSCPRSGVACSRGLRAAMVRSGSVFEERKQHPVLIDNPELARPVVGVAKV